MKKLAVLCMSALLVFHLAACGKQESQKQSVSSQTTVQSALASELDNTKDISSVHTEATGGESVPNSSVQSSTKVRSSSRTANSSRVGNTPAAASSRVASRTAAAYSRTAVQNPPAVSPSASSRTAATQQPTTGAVKGKTLIVYYSATGSTEKVAKTIAAAVGGDTLKLEPVKSYSSADLNWTDQNSRVVQEHNNPSLRDIELVKNTADNWDEYDTVFIGYPIWWQIAAWPVDGFVKANSFAGKNVIPFCTSSSSGLGDSGRLLAEMAGTGNWLTGQRFSSGASEQTVRSWVESLNLGK